MSKGIYWLASYPKSGNTWFRIVLTNVLHGKDAPIDLDQLDAGSMASNRMWVNQALGFDSTYLSDDELDKLRPFIYAWYARENPSISYHKIHDAYTYLDQATPLIPTDGCLGAIYIVRNPLDVAISFAHHSNCSIDMMIELMRDETLSVPIEINRHRQLRQHLLSWSKHVKSWQSATNIRVLLLRYEDMLFSPMVTFRKAMDFLHINVADADLQQAIDNASFKKLQKHEMDVGFKEKSRVSNQFFRKGIAGDWEATLNEQQVQTIISNHAEVMFQHGYLDQDYQPIRYGNMTNELRKQNC